MGGSLFVNVSPNSFARGKSYDHGLERSTIPALARGKLISLVATRMYRVGLRYSSGLAAMFFGLAKDSGPKHASGFPVSSGELAPPKGGLGLIESYLPPLRAIFPTPCSGRTNPRACAPTRLRPKGSVFGGRPAVPGAVAGKRPRLRRAARGDCPLRGPNTPFAAPFPGTWGSAINAQVRQRPAGCPSIAIKARNKYSQAFAKINCAPVLPSRGKVWHELFNSGRDDRPATGMGSKTLRDCHGNDHRFIAAPPKGS